ncbi:transcriptional regulator [Salsuginibacillus halophilus]|uniref:Transcriptional regulator n=1 Tax=Salsuginibacillus halophilus TaxID=517424 RepID=A0A2P8HG10_9BACI|nr:HTH-type transcriptional regulator Hpr [Salsuginibacillus halophilus]PSL45157.1 transcriptional regulator [Salsuginibacillus halophilus]
MDANNPSTKQSIIFTHKLAQLSKALWKSAERDWQEWLRPFELNINEHHILWILYHFNGSSVSDLANFGVMHVSTAFNFSKKLEARGLLTFSKKADDKRNTYVYLTPEGKALFLESMAAFQPEAHEIYEGTRSILEEQSRLPEFPELLTLIGDIYGDSFMEAVETSAHAIEQDFTEHNGQLVPRKS